ncbi:Glycosyl transferase, family 51 domain protein, partial [Candidatus Magnetoovum chiemensis]
MSLGIYIFSADKTRGNVLLRTLEQKGLKGRLFNTNYELKNAINTHVPSIIVFDTLYYYSNDLSFLKWLNESLPNSTLIAIGEPNVIPSLTEIGIRKDLIFENPFDPEEVIFRVSEIFFIKSKKYLKISTYFNFILDTIAGKKSNPYLEIFQNVFLTLIVLFAAATGAVGGLIYWILSDLPKIQVLENYSPLESSYIYASDNELLAELYLERRSFLSYYKIPKHVKDAFISIEDIRFYSHSGIDFVRIFGALANNIKSGMYKEGASTITQQLAKMLFLKPEKTMLEIINEAMIARNDYAIKLESVNKELEHFNMELERKVLERTKEL